MARLKVDQQDVLMQGMVLHFADGFMLNLAPAGSLFHAWVSPIRMTGTTTDPFGVPEHAHDPIDVVAPAPLWGHIDRFAKRHGHVVRMDATWMRVLMDGDDVFTVVLFGLGAAFNVLAIRSSLEDLVKGRAFIDAAPPVPGEVVQLHPPAHDHWFPVQLGADMPLAASLWIFRHLTSAQLTHAMATCNCTISPPPLHGVVGLPGGPLNWDDFEPA